MATMTWEGKRGKAEEPGGMGGGGRGVGGEGRGGGWGGVEHSGKAARHLCMQYKPQWHCYRVLHAAAVGAFCCLRLLSAVATS